MQGKTSLTSIQISKTLNRIQMITVDTVRIRLVSAIFRLSPRTNYLLSDGSKSVKLVANLALMRRIVSQHAASMPCSGGEGSYYG